jgi:hypothetical protein
MPPKSIAASNCFCVTVQKCCMPKCNKNGTHHVTVSANYSSGKVPDSVELEAETWYCDKHYNQVFGKD